MGTEINDSFEEQTSGANASFSNAGHAVRMRHARTRSLDSCSSITAMVRLCLRTEVPLQSYAWRLEVDGKKHSIAHFICWALQSCTDRIKMPPNQIQPFTYVATTIPFQAVNFKTFLITWFPSFKGSSGEEKAW